MAIRVKSLRCHARIIVLRSLARGLSGPANRTCLGTVGAMCITATDAFVTRRQRLTGSTGWVAIAWVSDRTSSGRSMYARHAQGSNVGQNIYFWGASHHRSQEPRQLRW
jgi:hypothetical protein